MMPQIEFLKFNSRTIGQLVFARVLTETVRFMAEEPRSVYNVMIGSDSNGSPVLDLVSVIAIHRVGRGGRYFWCRQAREGIKTPLGKIENLTEMPFDFKIHVDVGTKGETRDLVREVTGMVRGYGYEVLVKPESAAATPVAD